MSESQLPVAKLTIAVALQPNILITLPLNSPTLPPTLTPPSPLSTLHHPPTTHTLPTMGHVFIIQSDLTQIACDAVLIPTDRDLRIEHYWPSHTHPPSSYTPPPEWTDETTRAMLAPPECVPPSPEGCLPVYINVGLDTSFPSGPDNEEAGLEWLFEAVVSAVTLLAAHKSSPEDQPAFWRSLPLVALPLIGTGKGGMHASIGAVIAFLVPRLQDLAADANVDLALVAHDEDAYAALQAFRRRRLDPALAWRPLFGPDVSHDRKAIFHSTADSLVASIERNELALFIGAGASAGAGLPTWGALLRALADAAGIDPSSLSVLPSFLDQAHILEERLGGTEAMGSVIASQLRSPVFSLTHALLASLQTDCAITTNYDNLFEAAMTAAKKNIAVLPDAPNPSLSRSLLKMHGCVSNPASIVLSREHYQAYGDDRAALAGLVQSALLTKHLLLVGFGLTDENFSRIVSSVRASVRSSSSRPSPDTPPHSPAHAAFGSANNHRVSFFSQGFRILPDSDSAVFGTALSLFEEPLVSELWKHDLDVVGMAPAGACAIGDSARVLQIFLDYVGATSSSASSYLLSPRFDSMLSHSERDLKSLILAMFDSIPASSRSSITFSKLKTMFLALGGSKSQLEPPHDDHADGDHEHPDDGEMTPPPTPSFSLPHISPTTLEGNLNQAFAMTESAILPTAQRGHVFVIHGNILELQVDSYMLSAWVSYDKTELTWNPFWTQTGISHIPVTDPTPNMVLPLSVLPEFPDTPDHSMPWAADCSGKRFTKADRDDQDAKLDYIDATVQAYFAAAAAYHHPLFGTAPTPLHGRSRHMVALPVVGTGYAGSRSRSGGVLQRLLPRAYAAAATYGYDVVLVAYDRELYAAAMAVKGAFLISPKMDMLRGPGIPRDLADKAAKLAQDVADDSVTLLYGESDAAARSAIFDLAAAEIGLEDDEDDATTFASMSLSDQVRVLTSRLMVRRKYSHDEAFAYICSMLRSALNGHGVPLQSWLLANLGVSQIATTAWDSHLERACFWTGIEVHHLPSLETQSAHNARHPFNLNSPSASGHECPQAWIVKLAGDLRHPTELSISPTLPSRVRDTRMGVAQAMVISNLVLALGTFEDSLANVHTSLLETAQQSVHRSSLGTMVTAEDNPFVRDCWPGLDVYTIGAQSQTEAERARSLEIFLDELVVQTQARNTTHVLDPSFDEALSSEDLAVASAVRDFLAQTDVRLRSISAFRSIAHALTELGYTLGTPDTDHVANPESSVDTSSINPKLVSAALLHHLKQSPSSSSSSTT